jgi:phosphoglycerate dehydrogenase-like enzyme
MKPILLLSKHAATYRLLLEAAGLAIVEPPSLPADTEIVFGEPGLIRAALPHLPNLRWAQSTWAGIEPLLDPSLPRGYTLTNARGVFGSLMSEYVFGYLLAHERKLLTRWQAQQNKSWDASLTGTLKGKTIGLLGVGSIGCELAKTARFFGLAVRGYTRQSRGCPYVDDYFHEPDLPAFASGLDYLVSVLPGTPRTSKIINAELLARLPASALFINVGRGSTLDEQALLEALEAGRLAGAVLDVTEQEPLPESHPFWRTKNLLLTFHTSAPSFPEHISAVFLENHQRYLDGLPLKYVVDFEQGY